MANGGVNRLFARLRARRPLSPPPCNIELVLPPGRIPGFLRAKIGTFRGVLPADGKQELRLFAANLQFSGKQHRSRDRYFNVDTFCAAPLSSARPSPGKAIPRRRRKTISRRCGSGPSPSARPTRNSWRMWRWTTRPRIPRLEVSLGRLVNGRFQADLVRTFAEPRQRRIGFSPSSPSGALLFDAVVQAIGP